MLAGVLAVAVFLAAAFGLWQAFGRDELPPAEEPPAVDALASVPVGWSELQPPPANLTSTTVWTGTELLSWGGGGEEGPGPLRVDGFRFDPVSGSSAPIPPAPLEPRANPVSAWTGEEMLVWGGWREGPPFFGDGAAYDPSTDTWRLLPAAPISPRIPLGAWTGTEWILWGTGVRVDDRPIDGAAYDPSTNTWRSIADGPVEMTDATAVWTGREFVVVGAALHGGNFPETQTAIAAAYDPSTDSWRGFPASPLDPNSNTSVWDGTRVVGVDYGHTTAQLDPGTSRWTEMERLPGADCEGGLGPAVSMAGWVAVTDCGTISMLQPGSVGWLVVDDSPQAALLRAIDAGEVLFLSFRLGDDSPGLWAFRPPDDPAALVTRFFPSAESSPDGGKVTLPVTFPDGATATLRFPYYFEIHTAYGARPSVSWLHRDDPPPRYAIGFFHGPVVAVEMLRGDGPVAEVQDPTGTSREVWRIAGGDSDLGIVYELPEWTVVVPAGPYDPATVAAAFSVVQDELRFPVVTATEPFALSNETGEGEGARLWFDTVMLEPGTCTGAGIDSEPGFVTTCAAEGRVTVSMYTVSSEEWTDYAREVVGGIEVVDLVPAPDPGS